MNWGPQLFEACFPRGGSRASSLTLSRFGFLSKNRRLSRRLLAPYGSPCSSLQEPPHVV